MHLQYLSLFSLIQLCVWVLLDMDTKALCCHQVTQVYHQWIISSIDEVFTFQIPDQSVAVWVFGSEGSLKARFLKESNDVSLEGLSLIVY